LTSQLIINFFQLQKFPTSIGDEINAVLSHLSASIQNPLNRGTQSKNATSCGITEMTDIVSAFVQA